MRPEGGAERSPFGYCTMSPLGSTSYSKWPEISTSVPSNMRKGFQFSLR